MRALLTILLLAGTVFTGFSQQSRFRMVPSPVTKGAARDTVIDQLKNQQPKNQSSIDNMPNAIPENILPPVYKGNNGQGFDIYDSPIDHMPIVMPDKVNRMSLGIPTIILQRAPQIPQPHLYMIPKPSYPFPSNPPTKLFRYPKQ